MENVYFAGFWQVVAWIIAIGIICGGILGISEKITMLYDVVGAKKFWKNFWFVVGDIIVSVIIFLLLNGLKGLALYGAAFGIAIITHGLGYAISDSESASSDPTLAMLASLAYKISYLAIFIILLAPVIGIVLFLGVKFGNWELN